jgi:hypothetical protein
MSDAPQNLTPTHLTPANQNPWYVLMTLYGEQNAEHVDWDLYKKNRAAWNAWACQAMEDADRAKWDRVDQPDWRGWDIEAGQVMADHKAAMMARNGAEFTYPGFPDPSAMIELSRLAFACNVAAQGMLFPGDTSFESATFSGAAFFGGATFGGGAGFFNATFGGKASFDRATFNEAAGFGDATFSGAARFTDATFGGAALFDRGTFSGEAWFDNATFSGEAWFDSATFKGPAWFDSATFGEEAWFSEATFSGPAVFSRAKFGLPGKMQSVTFANCHFAKPTTFHHATFHASYPDFTGAMLHDKTDFSFGADNWPKDSKGNAEAAKASCATIRHNLGKQGLPEAEHFFFRREMEFAGQIGGWWQRLPYRAFGTLSDYGHSIARPALWLVALWAVVGTVIHALLQWQVAWVPHPYHPFQAYALSAANLVSFLGFQRAYFPADFMDWLPASVRVLSALETISGVLLLFFLGLGLRTTFRLR